MSATTSCSCGECVSCTQATSCLASCENGPVSIVNKGSYVRVSDRNGNPANLRNKNKSLLVIGEEGVEARDGSASYPITLDLDDSTSGEAIVVATPDGKLAIAKPLDETNQNFGYYDGALGFRPEESTPIEFDSAKVSDSSVGFLVGLTCGEGNKLKLTKFKPDCVGIRNLVVEDGEVRCDTREVDDCPDAELVEDGQLDYILGCKDGKTYKIAPEANKVLKYEDGKWSMEEDEAAEIAVFGANIYSRTFTDVASLTFSEDTVQFGGAVPATAKWVQIRLAFHSAMSTTYGVFRGSINGTPILIGRNQGSFQGLHDSACLYIPYKTGSFTISGKFTIGTSGSSTADGFIEVGILSYR